MSQVLGALARHGARKPDAIAVSGDHIALTWAGLAQAVEAAGDWLEHRLEGLAPGAPVAVALDNGPAWVIVDLALMRLGRPSLPLPPFFTPAQRRHALGDAGACLLLRPPQAGEAASTTIAAAPVVADTLPFPPRELHPGVAKITYTSGSTGAPKGVCLSLRQMEAVGQSLVTVLGAKAAQIHLASLPLGVLLENVAGLYASLLAGGRYHAPGLATVGFGGAGFEVDALAAAASQVAATSLILTPEMLRALIDWRGRTGAQLPHLTMVAVGGAKVAPQLIDAARAAGLPVYEGYGLSECASVVTLNTPVHDRPGSVGQVLPHLALTLADDGELIVGPAPFLGYVGGPACVGAWPTGDLGSLSADGFVSVTGRKSNLLITGYGRNVAPEWVESELLAQPEIGQAVVFGEGAASLCALVVPALASVTGARLEAAVQQANSRLPDYARVGRWRLAPPFDRAADEITGNGRARRAVLHDTYRAFIDNQA